MHRRISLIYCLFALSASSIAAVQTTVHNKEQYDLVAHERAQIFSYAIDEEINTYNNLLQSLYAFYQTSGTVNKNGLDIYFKNWENQYSARHSRAIAYGYIDNQNQNNSFFTIIGKDNPHNINSSKIQDILSAKKNSDPYFFSQKTLGHKDGKIFIIFNSREIINHLVDDMNNSTNGINLWPAEKIMADSDYHRVVFRKEFLIGEQPFDLAFTSTARWNNFGMENVSSLIVFVVSFLSLLFLSISFVKITQRARIFEIAKNDAEKKYKEQSIFFSEIIENLPGILFIKDIQNDYKFYMVNKAAEEFFGYDRKDLIGKSDSDFFDKEESSFFLTVDQSTVASGKLLDIPCETVTTKSGEMFCHTRKFPIFDENGNPEYLIGLSEDITLRKRAEMELAAYRDKLEIMVDERTEKLKNAIDKAEEANRLKSEFLATMSHEIRSPMSGVLGMAELLLDTNLTPEQKGLTKTILNSGEVLMNIIEDILDFSKIEANKLELDPIPVNMLEVVDEVSRLYYTKARDKALELAVRYVPGSEHFVYADPMRIRQVLGNLTNNAIKFTESGHVIITVREDFDAGLRKDKVKLIFTVEDSGIGIDEKDQERIFEKFSQANSSTTRNYGGTGLGLSICRKLIELMGGEIFVTSSLGQGSCFEFHLSFTRNLEEVFIQPQPPVLKDLRVLVVDDFSVIREILSEQLTNAGMICDTVPDGQAALEKLMESHANGIAYDIAIIDYLMPGMNGEMLSRAMNDHEYFRNICLIMLTAAGNPITGDDYAEKGFSAYISKPVSALRLIDTLAIVWSKYKDGYTNTLIRVDMQSLGITKTEEDMLHLDGARVLLVEDSRLNQAFAEEVLSQLSCVTTTVSNGREAIDCLRTEKFDLVLMDCQMPVMDGFEASMIIRDMKKNGMVDPSLPIIALTANAMKGDKQRCIDAGMDDYITKPVRKKELKEKIVSWIGSDSQKSAMFHGPARIHNDELQTNIIVDQDILDEAKSILKDKFDFMVDCYIEDVENYIKAILEAAAKHDLESLLLPAHTIKSTSKRMGALHLSSIAMGIELSAREAANSNQETIWNQSAMLDNIKIIESVFEKTRSSLLESRAR